MAFSEEEVNYILGLYFLTLNAVSKAKEIFERNFNTTITTPTIRAKWKKGIKGYKPQPHGGFRRGKTDEEIIKLYELCDGNIIEMERRGGYVRFSQTLRDRCKKLGLDITNPSKIKKRKPKGILLEDYLKGRLVL